MKSADGTFLPSPVDIFYVLAHKLQIYCAPFNIRFSWTITEIKLHVCEYTYMYTSHKLQMYTITQITDIL